MCPNVTGGFIRMQSSWKTLHYKVTAVTEVQLFLWVTLWIRFWMENPFENTKLSYSVLADVCECRIVVTERSSFLWLLWQNLSLHINGMTPGINSDLSFPLTLEQRLDCNDILQNSAFLVVILGRVSLWIWPVSCSQPWLGIWKNPLQHGGSGCLGRPSAQVMKCLFMVMGLNPPLLISSADFTVHVSDRQMEIDSLYFCSLELFNPWKAI